MKIIVNNNVPYSSPYRSYANVSKLVNELNWQPEMNLETGIQKMINFYVKHKDII